MVPPPPPPPQPAAASAAPAVDVTKLLAALTKGGVLQKVAKGHAAGGAPPPPRRGGAAANAGLSDSLAVILHSITDGRPLQCKMSGVRFASDEQEKLRQHMDYLFRRNQRTKKTGAAPPCRRWCLPVAEWIALDPISEVEIEKEGAAAPSIFDIFASASGDATSVEPASKADKKEVPIVRAPSNVTRPTCKLCGEAIEMFWDGDKAEWMLRDAVAIEGEPDVFGHSACIA